MIRAIPCPVIAAITGQKTSLGANLRPPPVPQRENDCRMPPVRIAVSRRFAIRGLASAATALAVGGCAGLAATGPRFGAADIVARPTLLVATTRKPVGG